MKKTLICCMLLFVAFGLQAQEKSLTVEKIFSSGVLQTKGIQMMKWMKDGESYSRIERNGEQGALEIVRYDAATNARTILVAAEWLNGENGKALRLQDYTWSDDNQKMLLYHNAQRVWRYPTRGDYQVLDMKTGSRKILGKGLPEASLMFAKFSPDGQQVAYVSRNNIYVENLSTQKITQLTFDGNEAIINGTFDWVYEEELDCRDGFRWSPDSKSIAYWQSDTKGTGVFYMIDNIDSIYSKIIPLPYPKVGTTLSAVKVGVIPVAGGATQWIDIPGNPRDNYLPRMDYIPGSGELMVHQFNRLQNTNTVWHVQPGGRTEVLFTETDKAWVEVCDELRWLDKNQSFTWMSERDGWRHLYKISRDGKKAQCLTPGNFDVIEVAGMDQDKGWVYFIATEENFTQRYLYRASLSAKPKVEKIEDKQKGQHAYNFSPTAKWAVHIFQNAETPPAYSVVQFPKNTTVRVLEDNAAAKQKFDALGVSRKEFIKVDIGDIVLDAWMIKPNDFTPSKKYPVIVHVYGEPAGSTVQDNWGGGDLWHRYLAQEGYIVVSIDNRGANVPRGREWRKCIYGKIGIINAADQAAGIQKMAQQYAYIDAERIGVIGWSGGGSMTLNCMFKYPGIYKTGIAVAFVAHQKLYDATYQERYMGLPNGKADDGFEVGSPINYAKNLEGNLLIVHGTGDDNVHYQNCEMLIDELVRHKKMFSLLSYPMRSHGIYEGENTSLHLRLAMDKYWKENLSPGGR